MNSAPAAYYLQVRSGSDAETGASEHTILLPALDSWPLESTAGLPEAPVLSLEFSSPGKQLSSEQRRWFPVEEVSAWLENVFFCPVFGWSSFMVVKKSLMKPYFLCMLSSPWFNIIFEGRECLYFSLIIP